MFPGSSLTLQNNKELLKVVAKESPDAYYEWTFNGIFIKPEPERIIFQDTHLRFKNLTSSNSGLYACVLFRINKQRLVFRVASVAVRSRNYDLETRATRSYTLSCNAVILGYVYSDMSLTILLNDKVYIDHGTTTLAAVNSYYFDSLNTSLTGDWKCLVEQKDLRLSWTTNYIRMNVKKAPNLFTNLMEDKLTAPLFSWMKTENNVLIGIISIVVFVFLLVGGFLVIYFKFCTLKKPRYKRNRRK